MDVQRPPLMLVKHGKIALETLDGFMPTLILLDLSMPVMDGWTMMAYIREDARLRTIPVIALTAHSLETDVRRVMEAGFASIIVKPFSPTKIIDEITKCLTNTTVSST